MDIRSTNLKLFESELEKSELENGITLQLVA